ncbi:peptidylprolyl isomerase [Brevundimonas sp. 2R-24]|uniref:Parvulin-like PPIase n=1 Tax=Peiella sedimenti TaxID=3061083 RepID=A0ABT8SPX7_9CAUL|nr:peptidylprolyl isomerase [Caulobacteraceae bacterium XZ-24]
MALSSPVPRLHGLSGAGALILALTLTLTLAACNRSGGDERPPQPGDVAVARVEGETVWASDVKREAVAQGLVGEGEPLDPASALFRRVLDEVVDQKLLAREAARRNLDDSPIAQRRLAAARERILGDMLVESVVDGAISDAAIQTLYEEQRRLARESEEIRARLILMRTRQDADAIRSLLAAGASFEALAIERSLDDQTRFNGGDLGYFTADVMPDAYAQALEGAAAGDTVGPFQTDRGWALLRVEDRRREEPPTLEQARPQIIRYLTYEEVRRLLERLRGRAQVETLLRGDPMQVPGAPEEPASAPPSQAAPAQPAAPATKGAQ